MTARLFICAALTLLAKADDPVAVSDASITFSNSVGPVVDGLPSIEELTAAHAFDSKCV